MIETKGEGLEWMAVTSVWLFEENQMVQVLPFDLQHLPRQRSTYSLRHVGNSSMIRFDSKSLLNVATVTPSNL